MRIDELAWVCQEAARDLARREPRPLPPAVVLPAPASTRVVKLADFPPDDAARHRAMDRFAEEEVLATSTPAYGFVAEGELDDGTEVVVVVYGAHDHPPQITAAPVAADGELGDFAEPEPLDPRAMPFVHPLQHAVDQVNEPPEPPGIPGFPSG